MRTTHQIAEPSVLDGNQTRVVTKTGTWQVTYDGYLLVHEERRATDLQPEAVACDYVWDPTEPVATRPLVFRTQSQSQLSPAVLYYTHDGNKNVSELVTPNVTVAARYEGLFIDYASQFPDFSVKDVEAVESNEAGVRGCREAEASIVRGFLLDCLNESGWNGLSEE